MVADMVPGPSRPRVTVIDDSAEMRSIMHEILSSSGHEVTTLSGDGDQVTIEKLAATAPDLIILDLVFGQDPDQPNGWDYLRLIRTHRQLRTVPVLVCSADVFDLRARADDLNADQRTSILEKPFSLAELEGLVAQRLGASPLPIWDDEREIVLVADAKARLVDASAAALRWLTMGIDQLRSQTVADLVAYDREWTATEWARYMKARQWEGQVTLRCQDGRLLPALSVAEIVSIDGTDWHLSRLTPQDVAGERGVLAG